MSDSCLHFDGSLKINIKTSVFVWSTTFIFQAKKTTNLQNAAFHKIIITHLELKFPHFYLQIDHAERRYLDLNLPPSECSNTKSLN